MSFYMIYTDICLLLFIFLQDLRISPFIPRELKTFKCLPMPLIDATMFGILGDN